MSDIKEYTPEIEMLFLQFMISDPELFVRVNNIVEPHMFSDRKHRDAVQFIKNHSDAHSAIPTMQQIQATCNVDIQQLADITDHHIDWFLGEFETFCRHKALEKAILESPDLLEKHDYGTVESNIRSAVQTGLVKDLGLDYFDNPLERLQWIKDQSGATSSGWKGIDKKLYGGHNKGEITIYAGGSGAGKSLFLQNYAVNWSLAGMNVVYVSFELSEQLISMRLDSMMSGYSTREIMKNMDDVHLRVKMKSKGAGKLRIKYMPNGSTANDLRAFLREYEIQNKVKVDALLIDYLDLMMPINKKVSPSDLFIKDKYVTEELRNLAMEWGLLCVTASQLNRAAVEEIEFDHSHIAGGLSKIQTADNVIGIFTSNAMRERGRYQIQFMKTRSSSGVGSKVDLKFDPDTLLIEDLDEGEEDAITAQTVSLVDQLKRKGAVKAEEPSAESTVNAGIDLVNFLKNNAD